MSVLKKNENILQDLGAQILKEAETYYHEHGCFSDDILQGLHSTYGQSFEDALDLLDRAKFIEYNCEKTKRHVFVITRSLQHFVLFENVNFCMCNEFKNNVLAARVVMECSHVLALRLAMITVIIKVQKMSEPQLVQLLNNQIGDVFKSDDDL